MARFVVTLVLVVCGAVLSAGIHSVVPPGWYEVAGDGKKLIDNEGCSTVAAASYNILTRNEHTSFDKDYNDGKYTPFDSSKMCDGSTTIYWLGVGIGQGKKTVYDHWFTVQVYGTKGQYAVVYQGFCASADFEKPKRQKKWYTGKMWMDVIEPHFKGQHPNRAAKGFVPHLARELPSTCEELQKHFIKLEAANKVADIKNQYNFLFAPPGGQLEKGDVTPDTYEGFWNPELKEVGDRATFVLVHSAATFKDLKQPAFYELAAESKALPLTPAHNLKRRIRSRYEQAKRATQSQA